MAVTAKYFPSAAVWLRLPGILLLELLLTERISSESIAPKLSESSEYQDIILFCIITAVLYLVALLLILLPIQVLKAIHIHVLWTICLAFTHFLFTQLLFQNLKMSSKEVSKVKVFPSGDSAFAMDLSEIMFTTVLTQLALCLTICWNMKCKGFVEIFIYLLPMLTWTLYLQPVSYLHHSINISICFSLLSSMNLLVRYNLPYALLKGFIRAKLLKTVVGWRGIIVLAVTEYEFTDLFMWAWITKVIAQTTVNKLDSPLNDMEAMGFSNSSTLAIICFISMVQSTATFISLIGIVIFISRLIKLQIFLVRSWLNGSFTHHAPDPIDDGTSSFIDGLIMMLVSVYVGLADLGIYSRAVFMGYIFLTIFSSQIRNIYTIVDSFLITLATVQTESIWKHFRTCLLALVLITICVLCSYSVVTYFRYENTFWTVVISHNFFSTIALTSGSLCIYLFMLLDSKMVFNFANIDDVTFYVRGSSEFFEFTLTIVVSLFVISNLYSDVQGIPATVLLVLYNYFNLMTKGKSGWRAWKMRREAGDKVESLREASFEEIQGIDDVCSICYQDLKSPVTAETVRITNCGHAFHGSCLRKWFQIQDKCPICHKDYNFIEERETEDKAVKEPVRETSLAEDTSDFDTEDQTVSEGESRSSA